MTGHTLDFRNGEAARKLIQRGQASKLQLQRFERWTLPGMLEFYLTLQSQSEGVAHIWQEIASTDNDYQNWQALDSVACGRTPPKLKLEKCPQAPQFFRLNTPEVVKPNSHLNLCFSEFQQQFVRVAKGAGFQASFAKAQVGIMQELADNVFQHSEFAQDRKYSGVTAFHAESGYLCFSVVDSGIGILKSLQTSTDWGHLDSDESALRAVIYEGASRKVGMGEGEGFKQLLRGLMDRNVQIRIRTGSSSVALRHQGDKRDAGFANSPPLNGTHVSLITNLKQCGEEKEIIFV